MMKCVILALICSALVTSVCAGPEDGKSVSSMGPVFRKYAVAHYGKWLPSWMEEKDRTREGYRVWLDIPCVKGEETRELTRFISGLIVRTNQVAASSSKVWSPRSAMIGGIESSIRYRRDMCFAICEKRESPTGGMLRGAVDFADDRYVSYTVSEHCWYMEKNAGEFVVTHGVYDRKNHRELTLSDLFPVEVMPELTEIVRKSYLTAAGGERFEKWEDFRARFPKVRGDGTELMDPVPNDNFILDDYGIVWSYNDAEVIGWANRRAERMLDVPVSWRAVRKLLRDRSSIPAVNSIWDCNMYEEE